VQTYGEAMDSADKATNKAMSAAYKYAAFLAFCIPTEGDNDADATTHEPAPKPGVTRPVTATQAVQPRQEAPESHATPEGHGAGVKVTAVKVGRRGENDKGPWTLHIVKFSDGREAVTFDDKIAARAEEAQRRAVAIRPAIDIKGDKATLTGIFSVAS
jgi:hypothetical protein